MSTTKNTKPNHDGDTRQDFFTPIEMHFGQRCPTRATWPTQKKQVVDPALCEGLSSCMLERRSLKSWATTEDNRKTGGGRAGFV